MDTGILKMPVICGVPLYRETPISSKTLLRSVDVRVDDRFDKPFNPPEIILGTDIVRVPRSLFKSIKVLDKERVVVESVFSSEGDSAICLYIKIVSRDKTDVLISMNGINTYHGGNHSVIPLSLIVKKKYWKVCEITDIFCNIVKPIYGYESLNTEVIEIINDLESAAYTRRDMDLYHLLYKEAPDVFTALVSGRFIRSPKNNLLTNHPCVNLNEDRWFFKDVMNFSIKIREGISHYNQQEFDEIAHSLISIRPAKMSMTLLMSHAIDGLIDLCVVRHFFDPYLHLFDNPRSLFDNIRKDLSSLVSKAALLYCQIYDIDYSLFFRSSNESSSMTIDKNINDEVTISFHDLVNDRYVSFYTYYPLISLGTFGVGRLI